MRANESVKNYPSTLRMYTNYADRRIRSICKEVGPRESGSESEKKAQEIILNDLKTCSDESKIEEFKIGKYAFMGWVVLDGILLLLAVIFSFLNLPIVSICLSCGAFIALLFEFLLYKEFLDPFFPKTTSYNAYGVKKATGELKQRIIFSGHIDSAYEWTPTYLGGQKLLYVTVITPLIGLVFMTVLSILHISMYGPAGVNPTGAVAILRWCSLAFVPSFITIMFFSNFKRPVMGANDNLTGAVTAVAILKYLEDNNLSFENTEIIALSTGSEEAGLRGAKAFIKAHQDEFKDVPTVFFGMDTLKELQHIAIYQRDMTGTVKNDMRVCALMKKGAELAGVDIHYASVWFGASDAAQVSKMGMPAATLAAMDPTGPDYYHTRRDDADLLERKTIEKSLDLCLQSLYVFDEYGLKDNYDDVVVPEAETKE